MLLESNTMNRMPVEPLPEAPDRIGATGVFCWTKYGSEGGQEFASILDRKELERLAGQGLFCWGIGNALRLTRDLVDRCGPAGMPVLFTPMKSAAKTIDESPRVTQIWLSFQSSTGGISDLPRNVLITSRGESGAGHAKRAHYALFCQSGAPLRDQGKEKIDATRVVNFASGRPIGASQVTALARYAESTQDNPGRPYRVAFRANLRGVAYARLANPVVLSGELTELYAQAIKATTVEEWQTYLTLLRTTATKVMRDGPSQKELFG